MNRANEIVPTVASRRPVCWRLSIAALLACAAGLPGAAQGQALAPELRARYDSAYFAWDRGDYVGSLEQAERLLQMPGGEALTGRVALLTGERFEVEQIAPDGRRLRWSSTGRHLSLETGTGGATQTHVVELAAAGPREVARFGGRDGVFSPDASTIAYLRVPASRELEAAREQERAALEARDRDRYQAARQRVQALEAGSAQIVVRDLATGAERVLQPDGVERHSLAYAGDGSLIVVGREAGRADARDLYRVADDGSVERLTSGPGDKGARVLAAGAERLVYTIGSDRFAVHHLGTGETRTMEGSAVAVSRDGSTLAYLAVARRVDPELRRGEAATGADVRASGDLNSVMVLRLTDGEEPREVKRTTLPLSGPALSPSGDRVAYTTILRDDWEVVVANADGSGEERLTRDIQHDLFPVFLAEDRVLAMMGEGRHRRSYLYDLGAAGGAGADATAPLPGDDQRGRTRLFHNNTIRTVAPQYEWAPDPEGTRVAVVADRDGDTLSPERGVYLVDLGRPVTRDAVLARVRAQLAAERELLAWGRETFAPIAAAVRAATAEVEPGRVYDHAHALYQFGSKYYTEPGNARAVEYLASSLRAMGYEPELEWFEPRPGFRTANVVATLRGTERPERIHVISSHFDSSGRAPGADDNSSGTTALLEAARVLRDRPQPETIRFAFLTAEEAGLLGAREHVRRSLAEGELVVSALNNDMVGWTRSHRLDNTIRYSNGTIRDLQHNAAVLFSELITYDARYVRSTDAQAFWDNYGDIIGGIGSYPILGNPHYHQPHDQLEVIDHRLVAEVARTTVATVMRLANGMELRSR